MAASALRTDVLPETEARRSAELPCNRETSAMASPIEAVERLYWGERWMVVALTVGRCGVATETRSTT